jgi:hypothetical protein
MFYVLFMCKCVLPPGVNPIAVDKYININISISIWGRGEVPTAVWFGNLRERDHLEDLSLDKWAVLNGSSSSRMGGCGLP